MKRTTRLLPGSTGSALLIALWALLLLSTAIFSWIQFIDQSLVQSNESSHGLEAKALAHSGVKLALHPRVTRQTTGLLEGTFGPERTFKTVIIGEAGKLNLNHLLVGEDDARLTLLKTHLTRRGLDFSEIAHLVDCLLDWIDADNIRHLNGVEDDGNYLPPNAGKLESIDEVRFVRGSAPLVSQPGWRDDFTLWTAGLIDLQYVRFEVLRSLPGVGEANAQRFIQMRQGADKTDGTMDDRIFKDAKEAMTLLGVDRVSQAQLTGLVTINDPTVQIISTGQSGKVVRQVEVVAQKTGGTPQIRSWKEK